MNTKQCENCGGTIVRPPKTSNIHWEQRRFCDSACNGAFSRKTCTMTRCDEPRAVGGRCERHSTAPRRLPAGELIRLRRLVNACEVCGGAMDHEHRETA